ncbi:MAG: hypothetical protein A3K67_08035 [Euryarchaeota archaeon RBG_16_62_10]|nr:MAG: hypothetical protein A3K67_08035 [Euryarchaeota archaeon RBG_16_62_10]
MLSEMRYSRPSMIKALLGWPSMKLRIWPMSIPMAVGLILPSPTRLVSHMIREQPRSLSDWSLLGKSRVMTSPA